MNHNSHETLAELARQAGIDPGQIPSELSDEQLEAIVAGKQETGQAFGLAGGLFSGIGRLFGG